MRFSILFLSGLLCGCIVVFSAAQVDAHAGVGHDALGAITTHTVDDRAQAQKLFDSTRVRPGGRSDSEVLEQCSKSKQFISDKINASARVAVADVSKLDSVFAAAQTYYKNQNKTIDGYDELVAAATTAQNAATIDSGVMAVLNRPLECAHATALVDVLAFRSASHSAAQSINDYRDSLTKLLQLLKDKDTAGNTQ